MSWIELVSYAKTGALITTGSIIGSALTALLNSLLEGRWKRYERQSSLEKEIYFKMQSKAEDVLSLIQLYRKQAYKIDLQLGYKVIKISDVDPTKLEIDSGVNRERTTNVIGIYFSNSLSVFETTMNELKKMIEVYQKAAEEEILTDEDIEKYTIAKSEFHKGLDVFISSVLEELRIQKDRVV